MADESRACNASNEPDAPIAGQRERCAETPLETRKPETSRGWRRWLPRVAALLFGLVLAALFMEAAVLLVMGEQVKFPRRVVGAPWGLRYNEPGACYRHKSRDGVWWFRINHQGMRADRDYSYAKEPGVKRIISLGDSYTVGFEVANDQTFSSVLEKELNAAGVRVEVLNAGVSGFGNAEQCLYLERELMKYQPDLVLVSFYSNDLDDNVRSGLFDIDDGRLVAKKEDYVPMGGIANFLNSNACFNFLSARSNAFAFLKERLTRMWKYSLKRRSLADDLDAAKSSESADAAGADAIERQANASETGDKRRLLAAAIFERIYAMCSEKRIPLLIQCIPYQRPRAPDGELFEHFPLKDFDAMRPGIAYLSAKSVLTPYLGKELLYWQHSQSHWTPFSHEEAGKALAQLVLEKGMLRDPLPAAGDATAADHAAP